jgi:hypothetical protein
MPPKKQKTKNKQTSKQANKKKTHFVSFPPTNRQKGYLIFPKL